MSHRAAELERQLWVPNPTDFPLVAERPESAQPRHCRTLWRRSLHNPICRPSLSCVADRRWSSRRSRVGDERAEIATGSARFLDNGGLVARSDVGHERASAWKAHLINHTGEEGSIWYFMHNEARRFGPVGAHPVPRPFSYARLPTKPPPASFSGRGVVLTEPCLEQNTMPYSCTWRGHRSSEERRQRIGQPRVRRQVSS
jgi:hypothetical protein